MILTLIVLTLFTCVVCRLVEILTQEKLERLEILSEIEYRIDMLQAIKQAQNHKTEVSFKI